MEDLRIGLDTPSSLDVDTAVRRLGPDAKRIKRSSDGSVRIKFGNIFMYRLLGDLILPEKFFPYTVVLTSVDGETSVQLTRRGSFSPVRLSATVRQFEKQAKKISELLRGS